MSSARRGWLRREFLTSAAAAGWVGPALAAPLSEPTFSFLAIGDWGVEGGDAQRQVAAAMAQVAQAAKSRFVLSAGDNFYPAGVRSVDDPHWKVSYEEVYAAPALQVPWYAALGNHDYRGVPSAQLAYARASARWRMPARYYAVHEPTAVPGGLDIFVLDTTPLVRELDEAMVRLSRGRVSFPPAGPQMSWLETQLAQSTAAWKIVVGHHPIYSGGKHGGAPKLVAGLEPLLERHGVQAYVCGHDHLLQHIQVGRTHHICSGAGASAGRVEPVAGTRFAVGRPGFAAFAFEPGAGALRLSFIGAAGTTLYEARLGQAG